MPCRDYMDDYNESTGRHLQERLDTLSRIACKALTHIEENGDGLEILILKDPEIATWWRAHKKADAAEQLRKRKAEIKAKLTPEELKILGVK